jgi:hypothetical protein
MADIKTQYLQNEILNMDEEQMAYYGLGVITALQGYEPLITLLSRGKYIQLYDGNVRVSQEELEDYPYILFRNRRNSDSGHFVYLDDDGIEWNSYTLKHQRSGTNQCCGTFALIYSLGRPSHPSHGRYGQYNLSNNLTKNVQEAAKFWLDRWNKKHISRRIDEILEQLWDYIYNPNEIESREGSTTPSGRRLFALNLLKKMNTSELVANRVVATNDG